jgi:ABC-type branched-subunit amino acid transport system substrate-binding protein
MKVRIAALMAVMVLVGTACGARLSDQERAVGVTSGAGGGAGVAGGGGGGLGGGSFTDGGGSLGGGGSLSGGGGGGGGGGSISGGSLGGGGTSGAGGGGGGGGSAGGGGGGGGGSGGGGRSSGGGSAAPAGGNGGATDTGVTANSIKIAAIADISGVQRGLFQSAWDAIDALAAFVNSQGGIYGRRLVVDHLDDQTNSAGNRARTAEACEKDFAIVGSMSAFDDGGASVARSCGIVDIPAITILPQHSLSPAVHAAYPNRPDYFPTGPALYIKKHYPGVIKSAGIIWLNAGAASGNAQVRIKAYEKLGFHFIYKQEVQVVEANYAPYVLDMRGRGVKYLTFIGDYQSIARLLQAMRQQGWYPQVRDWDSVVYDPRFLSIAGPAANGSFFYQNTALFDDVGSNKELQLYLGWLKKVHPSSNPTYFGEYAWSAGRLFVKTALDVGPHLTRKAMNAALEKVHSWSDFGLHGPNDIGRQIAGRCFLYGKIANERFQRMYPSSGFDCKLGSVMHL